MSLKKALILTRIILTSLPVIFHQLTTKLRSIVHRYTYKSVSNPKTIIIIGASFGGYHLATTLANSIPTGYRVLLIEKKSHFNFSWIFPRVSVVDGGHEEKAFVPFGPGISKLPEGSLKMERGTVVDVQENNVTLGDGRSFEFEFLVLATGCKGWSPWGEEAMLEKRDGVRVFREMQECIGGVESLVVVGGGAVGVELAADVKCLYPRKKVSLIHSRDVLLNSFGQRLHEYAMRELGGLGVDVYLGERVVVERERDAAVTLKSGKVVSYDLLVKCTGSKPASEIIAPLSPTSISPTGTILVKKTLQILDPKFPNIYALGDVAETGGVRMGRAAGLQAMVVSENIVRSIKGKTLKEYKPISLLEAGIDLTLGLTKGVAYFKDGDHEFLFPGKKEIALNAENMWRLNGARPFVDEGYDMKDV